MLVVLSKWVGKKVFINNLILLLTINTFITECSLLKEKSDLVSTCHEIIISKLLMNRSVCNTKQIEHCSVLLVCNMHLNIFYFFHLKATHEEKASVPYL